MCTPFLVDTGHINLFKNSEIEDTELNYGPVRRVQLLFNEVYVVEEINSPMHVQKYEMV